MSKLKPFDYEVISELIKNPRLSDRQLGKILRTSQPTVTRRRREIEKEELLDYTAIPDLKKLGFEILAITLGNRGVYSQAVELQIQKGKDFIERHPSLIYVSSGSGINSDRVLISIHKDYSDYSKFYQDLKQEWGGLMTILGSFMVSLGNDIVLRNLTFGYLSELMKENALTEMKLRKRKRPEMETKTNVNP